MRSVLLQGYPNLEYIVIDDGSTDKSIEVIRKYERWLAHWETGPNRGQAAAINRGLSMATGDVLAWLNSDDCLMPGALAAVGRRFARKENTQVTCGFRYQVQGDLRDGDWAQVAHLKPDRFTLSRHCYVRQETVFWRRAVWQDVGELNGSYQVCIDYDLWHRMLAAGYAFELLPRFIGLYRAHSQAKTFSLAGGRRHDLQRIYRKYMHSSKTEVQMGIEIAAIWWKRMETLARMARAGWLRRYPLAALLVRALSLPESRVAEEWVARR